MLLWLLLHCRVEGVGREPIGQLTKSWVVVKGQSFIKSNQKEAEIMLHTGTASASYIYSSL